MGIFAKGEIVILPFPFSDLTGIKRWPALVLSNPMGRDLILCQITSQYAGDSYCIDLTVTDFIAGGLRLDSYIRPNKLFTAASDSIITSSGKISKAKCEEVVDKILKIIS